jgi:hypothetical protein
MTDVVEDEEMTLCGSINTEAPPIKVKGHMGSKRSLIGKKLVCRIMEIDDQKVLSGAVYPFAYLSNSAITELMSLKRSYGRYNGPAFIRSKSKAVFNLWVRQMIAEIAPPVLIDNFTGDPIELITDYYKVKDWSKLNKVLCAQKDVENNDAGGWHRFVEIKKGSHRLLATINTDDKKDTISVLYRTRSLAEAKKLCFDELAGDFVEYKIRELVHPLACFSESELPEVSKVPGKNLEKSPEILKLMYESLKDFYANWSDEPIPALNNKTPREAIKSQAGLERVKGLLRSYQENENVVAKDEGREAFSFEFLWDSLGISEDQIG